MVQNKARAGCILILMCFLGMFAVCGFLGWLVQPTEADKQQEVARLAQIAAEEAAKEKHDAHLAQMEKDKQRARQMVADTAKWERNNLALAKFRELISDVEVIESTAVRNDGSLVVAVQNGWHYDPKAIRLQAAQNIGKLWEACNPGCDFSVVDLNGNEVGGRGFTGVWVSD